MAEDKKKAKRCKKCKQEIIELDFEGSKIQLQPNPVRGYVKSPGDYEGEYEVIHVPEFFLRHEDNCGNATELSDAEVAFIESRELDEATEAARAKFEARIKAEAGDGKRK